MRRPRGGRGSHRIGRAAEAGGSTSRRRRETEWGRERDLRVARPGRGFYFCRGRGQTGWLVLRGRGRGGGGGGWRRESSSDREHEHEHEATHSSGGRPQRRKEEARVRVTTPGGGAACRGGRRAGPTSRWFQFPFLESHGSVICRPVVQCSLDYLYH
jgi:hypothetical protein